MTTGTNLDVGPVARRWAAELLGVEENASSAEARRAYFRKLCESDFLPPRSLHHALRVFDGKRAPAEPDAEWLLEEEERLRADVESFAGEFFTLTVTQRRERWDALEIEIRSLPLGHWGSPWAELLSKCEIVLPLMARLQALKAGLKVEVQSLPLGPSTSFHALLAEHLLKSFPLPPLAQAASRQAFLRRIEARSAAAAHRSWEKAACFLLAEWPVLAALDQELVQHIAKLRSRLKRRLPTLAIRGKGNLWWLLLILLPIVLTGIFRGLTTSNNSSSSQGPSYSYSAPHDNVLKDLGNLRGQFVPDQKNEMRATRALLNLPPIHELADPSKFDVEIVNSGMERVLSFTPRPGSTITGPNGQQVNNVQPVVLGEATLRLMGSSPEQISVLRILLARKKLPGGTPNPGEVGAGPPKSSQGDKTRP